MKTFWLIILFTAVGHFSYADNCGGADSCSESEIGICEGYSCCEDQDPDEAGGCWIYVD